MTVQKQQEIVDLVMHRMALRHGSSTRRDFEVACLTIDVLIGSGTESLSDSEQPLRAGAQRDQHTDKIASEVSIERRQEEE